jgi:hypothetical protein
MTNSNCLENVCCPKCAQDDRFKIVALITCDVTDDGSEAVGDHEWDDTSATRCVECGFDGELKEFRRKPDLPPDPEGMNEKRASLAGAALALFMSETGSDEEDALGDFLAELMHWADRSPYDFDAALERARGHYKAETSEQPPA